VTEGDESLTKSASRGAKNAGAVRRSAKSTADPRLDGAASATPQPAVRGGRFRHGQSPEPTVADPLDRIGIIDKPVSASAAGLLADPVLPPIVPAGPVAGAVTGVWSEVPIPTTYETGSTTKVGPGRGKGARMVPRPPLVISPIDEPTFGPPPGDAPTRSYLDDFDGLAAIVDEADEPAANGEQNGLDELAAEVPAPQRRGVILFRRRPRARVRRVTRVVRQVDAWSVFKVALVFNAVVYVVCLTAGVLLWNVAYTTGTVENVEKFFEQFGWSRFHFKGGQIFHAGWIAGLFVAIGLTGFAVLLAAVFNLITDLVGGIRVSVLEEEVTARPVVRPAEGEG
jgi:hypothetical protein